MGSLKLIGPKRRESERVKNRSRSTSASISESASEEIPKDKKTPITLSLRKPSSQPSSRGSPVSDDTTIPQKANTKAYSPPASPAGDTIRVKHRMPPSGFAQKGSPLVISDDAADKPAAAPDKPSARKTSKPNRPWGASGKAPLRDAGNDAEDSDMVHADDHVEEYDFSQEIEVVEEDDIGSDFGSDTELYMPIHGKLDVITISSDDDRDDNTSVWDLDHRPWKNMDRKSRIAWETMYCRLTERPIDDDWTATEQYQREKDKEMLRYIEDFPLPHWVISQHEVSKGYDRLVERMRWRSLGIPIYGRHDVPGWRPAETQATASSRTTLNGTLPPTPFTSRHPSAMPPFGQRSELNSTAPRTGAAADRGGMTGPIFPNGAGEAYHPEVTQAVPVTKPAKGKGKARKIHTPPEDTGPRPPTPPYETREKPKDRRPANKSGRPSMRRQAEAEEFPWNRDMDFPTALANATWDDSIYDQDVLDNMVATRARNQPIMLRIDKDEQTRQRDSRAARKQKLADGSSDVKRLKGGPKRMSKVLNNGEGGSGDQYHSGHYSFATEDDEERAKARFGNKEPIEIMHEADEGNISVEGCKDLMIVWNPGKKGYTEGLEQAKFSMRDAVRTRHQLDRTPILTQRAAERIVDFCPDMLWRGMLLRIASEAGYGNKFVRDRMCLNGNYCDKATITKRIGSALGQKQQQSVTRMGKKEPGAAPKSSVEKVMGYAKGEDEFYNHNIADFKNYADYFGKRIMFRNKLDISRGGRKRLALKLDENDNAGAPNKRAKIDGLPGPSSDPMHNLESNDDDEDMVETSNAEEESVEGVSEQSDTLLDEIDDD